MAPKRRFWNEEQMMKSGFSQHFSMVTHALEKCFENPHFIFCSSFQNLRLGSIRLSKKGDSLHSSGVSLASSSVL